MEKADWDGVAELCEVAFRHIGEDWRRHVNPLVDYHGAQISEWGAWVPVEWRRLLGCVATGVIMATSARNRFLSTATCRTELRRAWGAGAKVLMIDGCGAIVAAKRGCATAARCRLETRFAF